MRHRDPRAASEVDTVLVPVGGGGLMAACAGVRLPPAAIKVIGVDRRGGQESSSLRAGRR